MFKLSQLNCTEEARVRSEEYLKLIIQRDKETHFLKQWEVSVFQLLLHLIQSRKLMEV